MGISWSNITIKLSQLIPWERNPRYIEKDEARRLLESFEKFGQVEPIILGPEDSAGQRPVYNGHQRLSVLRAAFGLDYHVAGRASDRELSEEERKQLTVFLHKGTNGRWDFDLLSEWDTSDLLAWGFQESDLGLFPELPALEDLKEQYGEPGERDFWPVIKVQVSPQTKAQFDQIMEDLPGADEADKFAALLAAVREERDA